MVKRSHKKKAKAMMLSPRHDAAVPQKDTFLAIWGTSHLLLQQFFWEIYDQEGAQLFLCLITNCQQLTCWQQRGGPEDVTSPSLHDYPMLRLYFQSQPNVSNPKSNMINLNGLDDSGSHRLHKQDLKWPFQISRQPSIVKINLVKKEKRRKRKTCIADDKYQ